MMKKVLFLCTENSCRSQMAEGILRHLMGDKFEVESAGTRHSAVNPIAIRVMAEIGIDISEHRSKSVDEFQGMSFDLIITTCDAARETCPVFPGKARHLHWSFNDPAAVRGSEDEILSAFRKVRDEIKQRIQEEFSQY
ncbi:MAG: arsenate reductase ArsC [Candidatus Methanoperedens sp.]|nr:arsenate reductase ArsC [Candidatus Methanoperedens sp.]